MSIKCPYCPGSFDPEGRRMKCPNCRATIYLSADGTLNRADRYSPLGSKEAGKAFAILAFAFLIFGIIGGRHTKEHLHLIGFLFLGSWFALVFMLAGKFRVIHLGLILCNEEDDKLGFFLGRLILGAASITLLFLAAREIYYF